MGEVREDGSGGECCWAGGELVRAQLSQAVGGVALAQDVWWTRGRGYEPGLSSGGRIWLGWPTGPARRYARATSRRRQSFVVNYDYDYDNC